jgi:hypothetical protein
VVVVTLTVRATGPVPADTAWERYADPRLWSTWSPQVQRVTSDRSRLATGMTGTVHAGLTPRPTLPVPFEVLDADHRARTWTWVAHLGPVRLRLAHGVREVADGTQTWLSISGPLPIVAAYRPVAAIALRRLVA